MRLYHQALLHSPSDLVRFLGCDHATLLDHARLRGWLEVEPAAEDAFASLLSEEGLAHEEQWRAAREREGGLADLPTQGLSVEQRTALTLEAMRDGARTIYQAAFYIAPWHGFADFLRRVEMPSALGPWSYEPVDTKLARDAKPSHVVQLGLYARMMAPFQGVAPQHIHVALGNDTEKSFRAADFTEVLAATQQRYHAFIDELERRHQIASVIVPAPPDPRSACNMCRWSTFCTDRRQAMDHLSQVAGLSAGQAEKLRSAGIVTVEDLAAARADLRVPGIADPTFARLNAQARLQLARRSGGKPTVELLPPEPDRGFALIPEPDPGDLFFDLEGDPLTADGLDYLWGIHYRDANGTATFRVEWAHDHAEERRAFEATVDWIVAHLAANPKAHVYHYAPYEKTALRRLSTKHASREEAVDILMRSEHLVDLYGILRQAIRTSEPNLSLKTMEIFFAEKRVGEVTNAGDSVIEYNRWKVSRDQTILDAIAEYNRVDCENTEGLRNWLLRLRDPDMPWKAPAEANDKESEKAEAERKAALLIEAVGAGAVPPSPEGRELVGHLVQFHRRAEKPAWWAMFDRAGADPEKLVEDIDCIGSIEPCKNAEGNWQERVARSTVAHYRFPDQETKLAVGAQVLHAPSLKPMGTITDLDTSGARVTVKRQLKPGEEYPEVGSIIPGGPVNADVLKDAVRKLAGIWAKAGAERTALPGRAMIDLIERRSPRLIGHIEGTPLVRTGEDIIAAATRIVAAMDETCLFVQGPPGTGKTYTSARVIISLIKAGKRIGVASNSHKAINNLLAGVETAAREAGFKFHGLRKTSGKDTEHDGDCIRNTGQNEDCTNLEARLVAGTAWLFARDEMAGGLDYLFVDEAGQVALGNLMAMARSTRNLVLVGDQMQLAQPIQGVHPGQSGMSALDYLLQGEPTVAPEKGLLLDTSWRMHPRICNFISRVVYDGRLLPHPDCSNQRLILAADHDPALAENGVRFVAMDHVGCAQRSEAEVGRAAALYKSLIGTSYIDRNGRTGVLGVKDILVVAPYNMQVNALKAGLPEGARVGTVDKLQGQEAEVVIVSMTTSTPQDLPRHVDFFYSKNRLNVAISRAKTLALVMANPKLLELNATSIDHLRLVNTLAEVVNEGT